MFDATDHFAGCLGGRQVGTLGRFFKRREGGMAQCDQSGPGAVPDRIAAVSDPGHKGIGPCVNIGVFFGFFLFGERLAGWPLTPWPCGWLRDTGLGQCQKGRRGEDRSFPTFGE
jgi:hypothetical protein